MKGFVKDSNVVLFASATLFRSQLGSASACSRHCCRMPWRSCATWRSRWSSPSGWGSHAPPRRSLWPAPASTPCRAARSCFRWSPCRHDRRLISLAGRFLPDNRRWLILALEMSCWAYQNLSINIQLMYMIIGIADSKGWTLEHMKAL